MAEISSFAANRFVLQQTMGAESRVQDLRIKASTGKESQNYAGISDDVRRLEGLESDHVANQAFQRNVDRTEVRLQEMESTTDTLTDVASRFRTQLLSAANGGGNLESIDLKKIAQTFKEEAVGVLNTEIGGRFLFSGSATNTAPIDFGGITSFDQVKSGAYYQGNDQTLDVRIGQETTLDYGVTADPENESGFHKLFTALQRVIETPDSKVAVERSIRDLSGAVAGSVMSFSALSDANTALDTAGLGFAVGNIDLNNADSGGTIDTINIAAGDSLNDVANKITNAANGLEGRVASKDGTLRLEIFSDDGDPIQVADNGATFNGVGTVSQISEARVDGAINELADTRSEIGSSRGLLETTKSQLTSSQTRIENNISSIEDTDLTKTMTLLAQNQTILESSFAITARLKQVSILNYLR